MSKHNAYKAGLTSVLLLTCIIFCGCTSRSHDIAGKAHNPRPADGTADVPVTTMLRWQPGQLFHTFQVYLGTESSAVENASPLSAEYLGATEYFAFDPPGDLEYGTTYYWRVDSVTDAGVARGDTWCFTTEPSPYFANFSASPRSGPAPLLVTFTDASSGSFTSWEWDFDNNGTVDSTEQNPGYQYTSPGLYTVSLTASGPDGTYVETKPDYVEVYAPPTADFTAAPTTGVAPLTVQFADNSAGSITSYEWDFDYSGSFTLDSTAQNPTHEYTSSGTYSVALRVTGPGGTDSQTKTDYITVDWPPPVAGFTADPTSGTTPLLVTFTDVSSGNITSREWDFDYTGSFTVDSTAQNPTHEYTSSGTYSVAFSVTGPGGTDTLIRADYITATAPPPPVADFMAAPTDGTEPLLVSFTDLSTGNINSWEWDFDNDGTVDSTVQHPTHTYSDVGVYTVKLTVTGPTGANSKTRVNYIKVNSSLGNVIYVDDTTGNDGNSGLSWDVAVKTIQTGLNKATGGWTVLVADGTYTGTSNRNLDFTGKSIHLKSCGGADKCIIDCQSSGRGFYFHSGETNNAIVEGFTIQNGKVTDGNGGGLFCENYSSPTIRNCVIDSCEVSGSWPNGCGGGMSCINSSPTYTDCAIEDNVATVWGGGVYCESSSSSLSNCTIKNNRGGTPSMGGGGGVACNGNSEVRINNCIVMNNKGSWQGGGILCSAYSPATITNCLVANNIAGDVGGGIDCADSSPTITNCTIVSNLPGWQTGGVHADSNAHPTLNNCIIWGNAGAQTGTRWGATMTLNFCCTSYDPLLVDKGTPGTTFEGGVIGDYHLTENSPCIDAASNALIPPGIITDLDGNARIIHDTVDMGCYEFVFPTYSAASFDTSFSVDDNNEKVIVESNMAKIAPEGDEFGSVFDTTYWTEGDWSELGSTGEDRGTGYLDETGDVLIFRSRGSGRKGLIAKREFAYGDADHVWDWSKTCAGPYATGGWMTLNCHLFKSHNNYVSITYWAIHGSAVNYVRLLKVINGSISVLADTASLGVQDSIRLRIKRVSATNTFSFYYDIGAGWIEVWSGVVNDNTYFKTTDTLYPVAMVASQDRLEEPFLTTYKQKIDDGVLPQWFWDDAPECGIVDSGASDWAFDAGAGKEWELAGATCVKSEPGTSSVLFKVGYSDTGNKTDVTWVDATWQTIAQVDTNAAAGNYDGHRYIHVKAQFNSDGTDQPSLSSFSISGRKVTP